MEHDHLFALCAKPVAGVYISITAPLMWKRRVVSRSYRHSQILCPFDVMRPSRRSGLPLGARSRTACCQRVKSRRGGCSCGNIRVDHESPEGRRARYFLSTDRPLASNTSDVNRTCWWHRTRFNRANSSSAKPSASKARMIQLSPSRGS